MKENSFCVGKKIGVSRIERERKKENTLREGRQTLRDRHFKLGERET